MCSVCVLILNIESELANINYDDHYINTSDRPERLLDRLERWMRDSLRTAVDVSIY